ncbi:hypothetical protein RM96_27890 [Cupriavidus sp. IDO]|nr:hypothetical protein RM96_27890 [Cupriavidus sp. IDO]
MLEDFVPKFHPMRSIRTMTNQAPVKMDRLFAQMYRADIKGGGDKDDNDGGNFKGRELSDDVHESKTDPDAKLHRRSKTGSETSHMRVIP